MECINLEYRRRLPPELLTEMHKCLPLANAIYVLVNVSQTFVINNSTRMHRTIQRIKRSLKEYIDTLVEAEQNDPEELVIRNEIGWKPELDALLRYGSWLTSTRKLHKVPFYTQRAVGGMPENFVQKLLLHLSNSSSTEMMLQIAEIYFPYWFPIPMPTFLKPLFNEKQFRVGNCLLFEFIELKMDNGQTICIHDGEFHYGRIELRLFVQNKMNGKEWFKITIGFDSSKEFIHRLKFKQWKMQSLEDVKKFIQKLDNTFEVKDDGNILEAKANISYNPNFDLFLRRGAKFTQFRHLIYQQFTNKLPYYYDNYPGDYVDFLINFVSNAKHPEEFLESIDFDLVKKCSPSIKTLWEICQKGIPEGGIQFDKKLHILSGKTTKLRSWDDYGFPRGFGEYSLEFTLANLPSNGKYLFDVNLEMDSNKFLELKSNDERMTTKLLNRIAMIKLRSNRERRQQMMIIGKKMQMSQRLPAKL